MHYNIPIEISQNHHELLIAGVISLLEPVMPHDVFNSKSLEDRTHILNKLIQSVKNKEEYQHLMDEGFQTFSNKIRGDMKEVFNEVLSEEEIQNFIIEFKHFLPQYAPDWGLALIRAIRRFLGFD